MSDIKILFNSYPTAFQKMGGGEKQIEQYYNFLKKKKILCKKVQPMVKASKDK